MENYNMSVGTQMLSALKRFEEIYANSIEAVKELDEEVYKNFLENEPLDQNEALRKGIFGLVFPICLKNDFPELIKKVNTGNKDSRGNTLVGMDHLTLSEKEKVRTNLTMRAFEMYTMWNWRKFKKIYSVDNYLIQELSTSTNYPISAEILRHAPFPAFYVNARITDSINGFFVIQNKNCVSIMYPNSEFQINWFTIDYENTDLQSFVKKHNEDSEENLDYIYQKKTEAGVPDEAVSNALKKYVAPEDKSKVTNKSTLRELMQLVHEYQIKNETLMITILMYILSTEADITEPNTVKNVRTVYTKKGKKKLTDSLDEYPVGVNIGPAIHAFREESEKHRKEIMDSKNGAAKCPHARKAHWHHYWAGPKENRHLILKWIAPCFINGYTDETKISNLIPMLG